MSDPYIRNATVVRVLDGDTVDVTIDLGFSIILNQRVRLAYIDAPEIRGEEKEQGLISKQWLESKIPPGTNVVVQTIKESGKYGRYIALIKLPGDVKTLNDQMIDEGYAKPYN